ncbi:TolC family protein [Massilia sp. W12]|uniref:TolC family protein n=1 Tax=Massilia sp. W12 TaxID=3126507 RepID=UPI0030D0439C
MATTTTQRSGGKLLLLPMMALLLSACAINSKPTSEQERQQRASQDLQTLFKDVEPLKGELTLHEAFARALKYNYDYRLRSMEQSMAAAQLDLSKYDMLPRLTVAAGYSSRNNDAGSRSVDLNTGVESNLFSGAQERSRHTSNAVLAWNILDFGVSYVRAQQQAEQVLISEERKRKVVQNIAQDVRQAFWRAYGAHQALPRLNALQVRVKDAMARSQRMESQRMMPPLQALSYQRALLDLHQQIVNRRQELILAKTELAALINLRPGADFTPSVGNENELVASMKAMDDLDALDQLALVSRPELREEDYRKRITVLEARKALYSMLPGVDLNFGSYHDSNKYLFKNNWTEASANISFNLLRAFSYGAMKKAQESQMVVDDTRRLATAMAVLTQVRLSAQRYQEARADYEVSAMGAQVDARIEQHMRSATKASAESEMELLRTEVKAALSEMQRYVALANMQTAYARVANSVGADLLPDSPKTDNLQAFAEQLKEVDLAWRENNFALKQSTFKPQVMVAEIKLPDQHKQDLGGMLKKRLAEHGADLQDAAKDGVAQISAQVQVGEAKGGMRQVEIVWQVKRADGSQTSFPFRSVIAEAAPNAWQVLSEAASESAAARIAKLLQESSTEAAQAEKTAASS